MATTVDELLIQVTLNAKQLQQSLNNAEQSITKFADKITNTLSVALEAIALKFSLSFGKNLVETFATTGSKLYFLSQQLGESVSTLDQWGVAVQKAGGNTDSFFNTINNLHNKLVDMKFNGDMQTAGLFGMMGIRTSQSNGQLKKTSEILLEISDFFKGQSKEQQQFFGRKLGLDDATVRVLAKGREETLKLVNAQKSLWNDKTAAQAERQREQLIKYDRAIEQLKLTIAEKLLPYANQFIDWIQKFVNQHGNDMALIVDKIVGALAQMVGYIPKVTAYIGELNKSLGLTAGDLGKIVLAFMGFKAVVGILSGVKTALSALTSPLGSIITLLAEVKWIYGLYQEYEKNPDKFKQNHPVIGGAMDKVFKAGQYIGDTAANLFLPDANINSLEKTNPLLYQAQQQVENARNEKIGYKMKKDANGKYQYVLDNNGQKIPEVYGKYQIKPKTASEVMGKPITGQDLLNDKLNTEVHDKYMQQLKKRYGSDEAALAAYNGDLANYQKNGRSDYVDKVYAKLAQLKSVNQQPQPQLVNQPVQNTLANAQAKPQQQAANNNVTMTVHELYVKADNPQELVDGVQSKIPVPLSFNQSPRDT